MDMESFHKLKHFLAMVFLQLGFAGIDILRKKALNRGMSIYVLLVYRQVIATLVIAPFAFFLEKVLLYILNVLSRDFYRANVKAYKPKSKTSAGDQEPSLNGNKEDEVKKFKLKSKIDTDVRELSSGANRGSKTRQTAGLGSAVTNAGANDSIKDGNDKLNSTCEDKEKKNKESMSYINNTCSLNNRYSVLSQN